MSVTVVSLVVAILCASLVWVLLSDDRTLNPVIMERLNRIKDKNSRKGNIKDTVNLVLKDYTYRFQALEKFFSSFELTSKLKNMINIADVKIYIDEFYIISIFCGLPFLLCLFIPRLTIISVFALPMMFLPYILLKRKIIAVHDDFSKQFPDALNLMASSLRAGHPLNTAMGIVVSDMPNPISRVFATAQKDIEMGASYSDSFLSMTKLVPDSLDLRFFITAVLIQKEVGGNLALLLDSLSATIRERFKLQGQLKVGTAQTKISAMILGVVPIAVVALIAVLNPEYIKPLFTTPDGKIAALIGVALMIIGFFMMKKIGEIEI